MKMIFRRVAVACLSLVLLAQTLSAFADKPAPPATLAPAPPTTPAPAPAATVTNAPAQPTDEAPKAAPKATKKKTAAKKPAPKKEAPPAEAAAPAAAPVSATVKQDRVNIRGQAALAGEVITQLKKGEPVSVLEEIAVKNPKPGEPAVWAKIAMPGNVPVWVTSEFVDPDTKAVKSARLNVRAGPGENFSIIGRLKKGDVVKEIRQVDNWTEIETPPGVFGFVALDLLVKSGEVAAAKTEPASVTPEPKKTEVAKAEPLPATPAPAPPANVPTTPTAPAPVPDPAVAPLVLPPSPAPAEPLPRRVVRREGTVRGSVSIQAPTPYCLEDPYDRRLINYLMPADETLKLGTLRGSNVVVAGEEFIDKRWPRTPILKIETLEAAP